MTGKRDTVEKVSTAKLRGEVTITSKYKRNGRVQREVLSFMKVLKTVTGGL